MIIAVGGVVGVDAMNTSKAAVTARAEAEKLDAEVRKKSASLAQVQADEKALMEDLQPRETMGVEIDSWQVQEAKLLQDAAAARTEWRNNVDEMLSLLKSLRASTEKTPLTMVTLKSGTQLRGCVIAAVDAGQVTFKHSDGVAKVAVTDLPFELVRRFFLNFDASLPKNLDEPELTPVAVVMPQAEAPPPLPPEAGGRNTPEATELRRTQQRLKAMQYQLKQFNQAKEYQLSLCKLFANPPDNAMEKIHFAKGLENAQIAGRRYVAKIQATEAEIQTLEGRLGTLNATPNR